MIINETYYDGFEGEPEIILYLMEEDVIIEKLGIWEGYFGEINLLIRKGGAI